MDQAEPGLGRAKKNGRAAGAAAEAKKRHPTGGFLSARTPAAAPFPSPSARPPPLRLLFTRRPKGSGPRSRELGSACLPGAHGGGAGVLGSAGRGGGALPRGNCSGGGGGGECRGGVAEAAAAAASAAAAGAQPPQAPQQGAARHHRGTAPSPPPPRAERTSPCDAFRVPLSEISFSLHNGVNRTESVGARKKKVLHFAWE